MLTSLLDGRVFAERLQAGPADVLALHGWGRDRSDLVPVVAGMRALLPDLPGFGATPAPPRAWGSADYAELLAPVLDDAEAWTLVGHSFGGRVAVHLATLRPDRVRALVLTGVPLLRRAPSRRPPAPFRLARALHRRGLVPDTVMERARQAYGSADYRTATGVMRDTLVRVVHEDYRHLLPRIAAPVELVWGASDTEARLDMAQQAVDLFPDARLSTSPTSGHLLDAALVALLQDRLRRLAEPSGTAVARP